MRLGITSTPSAAKFWSPVIYYGGSAFYPGSNLPISSTWGSTIDVRGLLDTRVIIYDANQKIIASKDARLNNQGGDYNFNFSQGVWKEVTAPPPPPPPSDDKYYIWADIQPAGAGQVTGVSWSSVSGALRAGPFSYGKTLTLTAVPASGYKFSSWWVNDEYAGAQTSLRLMVTTTLYIRVRFSEVVVPPPPTPPPPVGDPEFRNLICSYGRA